MATKKKPTKPAATSAKQRSIKKKARATAKTKTKTKAKPGRAPARQAPMAARRADYGQPIDGFFAKQPPALRAVLETLRAMIERAAPTATAKLNWGMPFYELDGNMLCGLGGHSAHVNLILPGPPGTYADPKGLLEGDGKTGRRLKLTSLDALPEKAVRAWLATAVARARG